MYWLYSVDSDSTSALVQYLKDDKNNPCKRFVISVRDNASDKNKFKLFFLNVEDRTTGEDCTIILGCEEGCDCTVTNENKEIEVKKIGKTTFELPAGTKIEYKGFWEDNTISKVTITTDKNNNQKDGTILFTSVTTTANESLYKAAKDAIKNRLN